MANLIIRDLDDTVARRLTRESRKRGLSVNRYLHQIVERAVAPTTAQASQTGIDSVLPKRNDLGKFAGRWTARQHAEFTGDTAVFGEVDPRDWQ